MKISTVFNRFYWNRMILNAYWSIFIIYIIAQILVYILGGKPEQYSPLYDYFIPYMILPDTLLILLLILLELLYRYQWRYAEEAILAGAFTISIIMTICIGPFIHGYLCIMILPLLISLISFHKKFLYVSFPLALLAIIFVPLLDATKRGDISIFEQILAGSIIVGTFVTSTGIIKRGYELLNHLERSMNSEQELLIQSVIMDRLSKTDALTDLYNHKTFHEYMERLIENQAIEPSPVALAVMDIDNFKQVNDTYGHWVGDLVLKE
ncbi:MAG TPA: GGDEF domain-containing protein, partial [Bacilli bacterium]